MAPWPEVGDKKAPDKEERGNIIEVVTKSELDHCAESELSLGAARSDQVAKPDDKEFLTLDEGQLKALLDEAITYKNPKDREGKSELFKELLQEAEADESNSKGLGSSLTGKLPRTYYNSSSKKRHNRLQGRECGVGGSTSRGGSLQNLHALGMDGARGARSRRNGRSNETLVSARQREGGSLPSNVNVEDIDSDSIICPNYTSRATLQVFEANTDVEESSPSQMTAPLPNGVETESDNMNVTGFVEIPVYQNDSPQRLPACISQGEATFSPSSQQQHVSMLSIPPSQLHTSSDGQRLGQLDSSEHKKLNPSLSHVRHKSAVSLPRSDMALVPAIFQDPDDDVKQAGGSLLGLPLSAQWRRYSSCTFLDFRELNTRCVAVKGSKAKSLDENDNALGLRNADSNNYQDRRKQRRIKSKNDRNSRDFQSNDVEGFRGNDDIDTLMRYIESSSDILDGSKSNKNRTSQTNTKIRSKEDESRPIKRRTKEKFQRCNSMEEISKSKLEDLTDESSSERINGSTLTLAKRQVALDDADVGKKLSWRDLSDSPINKSNNNKIGKASQEGIQQESEFHIVTKKHRKKKRRSLGRTSSEKVVPKPVFCAHDRTLEYRHHQVSAPQSRRKSASSVPPSDKSDSSDLDSVHSLPVSSTTTRTKVGKSSVSGGSTPQASYADIARTLGSSQDSMLPAASSLKRDAMTDTACDNPALPNEEYPPLDVKSVDFCINTWVKTECVRHRDNKKLDEKTISKTVPFKTVIPVPVTESVPDLFNVSRSSVKNLNTISNSKRPAVILVNEPTIAPRVLSELTFGFEVNQQLLECDNYVCSSNSVTSTSANVPVSSQTTTARDSSLEKLVYFVSSAWESVLKDVEEGRARYYDGQ